MGELIDGLELNNVFNGNLKHAIFEDVNPL